jgi:hypothetical protein
MKHERQDAKAAKGRNSKKTEKTEFLSSWGLTLALLASWRSFTL